jgi:hypothetical protein
MWEISGVGEGEVGAGGKRGGMTSLLKFWVQMCDHVGPKVQNTSLTRIFRGWAAKAGCVYSSKSIERFEFAFGKLLVEIEPEFVQNLKGLVDFEVQT